MTNHVMRAMRKARGAPLPLEKAALCVTLDVIGRVGFQKDFGATSSFDTAIDGVASSPPGKVPVTYRLSIAYELLRSKGGTSRKSETLAAFSHFGIGRFWQQEFVGTCHLPSHIRRC